MKRIQPVSMAHNPDKFLTSKLQYKQADRAIDTASHQISESQIFVGLGFIASLLFIGGMQLFRSVNANFSQIEPTSARSALTFNLEDSALIAPAVEFDSLTNYQKAEKLTIQNTISHGKF